MTGIQHVASHLKKSKLRPAKVSVGTVSTLSKAAWAGLNCVLMNALEILSAR